MTGTITALTDKTVTIDAQTFTYEPPVRWFLEVCMFARVPVEIAVIDGKVKRVGHANIHV